MNPNFQTESFAVGNAGFWLNQILRRRDHTAERLARKARSAVWRKRIAERKEYESRRATKLICADCVCGIHKRCVRICPCVCNQAEIAA